jgi:hypothetical protein
MQTEQILLQMMAAMGKAPLPSAMGWPGLGARPADVGESTGAIPSMLPPSPSVVTTNASETTSSPDPVITSGTESKLPPQQSQHSLDQPLPQQNSAPIRQQPPISPEMESQIRALISEAVSQSEKRIMQSLATSFCTKHVQAACAEFRPSTTSTTTASEENKQMTSELPVSRQEQQEDALLAKLERRMKELIDEAICRSEARIIDRVQSLIADSNNNDEGS